MTEQSNFRSIFPFSIFKIFLFFIYFFSKAWKFIYLFYIFIIVQVQLSPFYPQDSPPPQPSPFLTLHPTYYLLVLYMCLLYMVLKILPPYPPIITSHLPSGYYQFVLNFTVSGYILLACLFCWLRCNYRWDHMVFVFHHMAYFT